MSNSESKQDLIARHNESGRRFVSLRGTVTPIISSTKTDISSRYHISTDMDGYSKDGPTAKSWDEFIDNLKKGEGIIDNTVSPEIFADFVQKIEESTNRPIVKAAIVSINEDTGMEATEIHFDFCVVTEDDGVLLLQLDVYATEGHDCLSEEDRDNAPYNVLEVHFPPVSYRTSE